MTPLKCEQKTDSKEFLQFAQSFEQIGDIKGAIKCLKVASLLYKDDCEIKILLAKMYNKLGQIENSVLLTTELMKDSPTNYQKHFSLIEDLCWSVLQNKARCEDHTYAGAMQAALGTNDIRSINMLISGLHSPNFFVRYVAIKLAYRIPDYAVQENLIRRLQKEKVGLLRQEICSALRYANLTEAREALEKVLANTALSSQERGYACHSLCHLYPVLDSHALNSLIEHKRPDFRILGIHLLKKKKVEKASTYLQALLQDPVLAVRQSATQALLEHSSLDASIDKSLRTLSETDHPSIAINTALILTKTQRQKSQKSLMALLSHKNQEISSSAAYFLAKLITENQENIESIFHQIQDSFVRANFAIALFEKGNRMSLVVQEIENLCLEKSLLQKRKIHFSPCAIFEKSSAPYLPHVHDYPKLEDIGARFSLLSMLCVANSKKAHALMKSFLKERMWGVSASFSFLFIQEWGQEKIDLIQKLAKDEDPVVSMQASLVLAFLKQDSFAFTQLTKHYKDCSYPLKLTILEALGRLGDKKAIPFLLQRLQEPFETTSIVAASSIIQCLYH